MGKYIKPNDNIQFASIGKELEFFIFLQEYYLTLREDLKLKDEITFGLELEFENINNNIELKELKNSLTKLSWNLTEDSSLTNGAEAVSPILTDNSQTWVQLQTICTLISKIGTIDKNSSSHVHVGVQILGDNYRYWLNFIKLWSTYEHIIFRFLYGQFLTNRPSLMKFARPLSEYFYKDYKALMKMEETDPKYIINFISHNYIYAINLFHIKNFDFNQNNTIEFRNPNGSLEPAILQNNVNFLTKLLLYSASDQYNDDIINKRIQSRNQEWKTLEEYNKIYLNEALELSDLIFDNNLDKLYFLRQYLKDFGTSNEMKLSKKFIK